MFGPGGLQKLPGYDKAMTAYNVNPMFSAFTALQAVMAYRNPRESIIEVALMGAMAGAVPALMWEYSWNYNKNEGMKMDVVVGQAIIGAGVQTGASLLASVVPMGSAV